MKHATMLIRLSQCCNMLSVSFVNSMKLHGSGLAVSDSDESSGGAEDIDDYLEAALNEMDKEEVGSGESPLRNRNGKCCLYWWQAYSKDFNV